MSPSGNTTIEARRVRHYYLWCIFLLLLLVRSSGVQAEEHDKNPALIRESQYQALVAESSVARILKDDQEKAAPTDETPDKSSGDDDNKKEATPSSPTATPPKKKDKNKEKKSTSTDLCSSAANCEECLQLSTDFKANNTINENQVCIWNGSNCTTGSSKEFPNADQMCASSKDQQEPPTMDVPDKKKSTTNAPTAAPKADEKKEKTPSPTEPPSPAPEKTTSSPTQAPTASKTTTTTKSPTDSPTSEPTKSPTKAAPPPTEAPTPEPTKSSTPAPETTTPAPTSEREERDHTLLTISKLLFGIVLLIFMCYCYNRRKFTGHRHHHYGDVVSGPRYEGVSTREKDDEDDWDWDDDGGGDVELAGGGISSKNHTNTAAAVRPSSYQQPLYRDQPMPRAGRHDTLKRRSNSGDGSNDSPSPPPKSLSPKKQPPLKMPLPKTDDIFAEMGFSAKPTFGKATTVNKSPVRASPGHGLGAVHLPPDDGDNEESDNWDDDADLDDLLND